MKHLTGINDTTIVNASIEDGFLVAGMIAVGAFVTNPTEVRDLDTGVRYLIELPEELTNQNTVTALVDEYLPLIQVISP